MLQAYITDTLVRGTGSLKINNTLGFVLENTGDTPITVGVNDYSLNMVIEPKNSRTFEVSYGVLYNVEVFYKTENNGLLIIQTKPLSKETIS